MKYLCLVYLDENRLDELPDLSPLAGLLAGVPVAAARH